MNINVQTNGSNSPHPQEWPEGALTRVPFWIYQSPEIYAAEQHRIFEGPTWNYLCLECEIAKPGDYRTTFIGTMPVVVARDFDDEIYAFENRCAHRGGSSTTSSGISTHCHQEPRSSRSGGYWRRAAAGASGATRAEITMERRARSRSGFSGGQPFRWGRSAGPTADSNSTCHATPCSWRTTSELTGLLVDRATRAAERESFLIEREQLIRSCRPRARPRATFLASMSHELPDAAQRHHRLLEA